MCSLQIINDIEPLSLTLHGLNTCFIDQPLQKSGNFDFNVNIFKEQSIAKKNWNVLLDRLMCALQIINDNEPLTLILHGVNAYFIHHP